MTSDRIASSLARPTQRLFTLPDETLMYPAHDYKGRTVSTIGEEKRLNPRFAVLEANQNEYRSREQFITLMNHLGLSYPKKMNEAVPANEYHGDFIPDTSPKAEVLNLDIKLHIPSDKRLWQQIKGVYILKTPND